MRKSKIYHASGTPDFPVSIGIETPEKHLKTKPNIRYHSEVEISLQVAGSTENLIDDQTITYHAGDIWIIPSETGHRRIAYSDDSIVHWILFSPDAVAMQSEHFFQKNFVRPLSEGRLEMPTLLQPGHPCYAAVYDALIEAKNCPYYGKNYKQKRLLVLMQLCLAIMPYCHIREDLPVIPETAPESVQLCMRYIQNRYHTKITMDNLGKFCHLHPNRLSTIFKQHTGQSVFEYLTKFRIEAAAVLLKREDLPVSKIAELVGFPSECLFYRKFKEIMGATPKAYAKQQINK
ncbi:MAG: helix-turn-helix domain-containing protein [Oscillospiraceae bacterium]|nr:helix-turn-helix domain-containing protein [Oscillospiraceae bacterium]